VKILGLIVLFCVAVALGACGDDDWAEAVNSKAAEAAKAEGGNGAADTEAADEDSREANQAGPILSVEPPSGPPPKETVIKDLKEGTGPAAKPGDTLQARFIAVDQAGQDVFVWNKRNKPFTYELGTGEFGAGWDKGLTGMKVGGMRELAIPRSEAFEEKKALYYVVEMLEIEPPSSGGGAGQAGGASP
jgi:peptidylprolyl isomerase